MGGLLNRIGLPGLVVSIFLVVLTAGYFDLRVNSTGLYGGEHANYAAQNKGMDFKAVYGFGMAAREGLDTYSAVSSQWPPNPYPPFVTAAMLPLTFLPIDLATHVFAAGLLAALFATVLVCLSCGEWNPPWGKGIAALVICAVLFQTYPVNFSIERGNSDIFAALFAALFLLSLVRNRPLLAVAFLTVSIQFKLYPAVLVVLLFLRQGWRPLLFAALANVAMLFILGKTGFDTFISVLRSFSSKPFDWPGNHSLHSFAGHLAKYELIPPEAVNVLQKSIAYAMLLLLLAVAVRVYRGRAAGGGEGSLTGAETGFVGMAFGLMSALPIISHDYKLVIHAVPLLLVMSRSPRVLFPAPERSFAVTGILALCAAFIFSPSYPPLLVHWLADGYGDLALIKTPWVLASFLAYTALGLWGNRSLPGHDLSRESV